MERKGKEGKDKRRGCRQDGGYSHLIIRQYHMDDGVGTATEGGPNNTLNLDWNRLLVVTRTGTRVARKSNRELGRRWAGRRRRSNAVHQRCTDNEVSRRLPLDSKTLKLSYFYNLCRKTITGLVAHFFLTSFIWWRSLINIEIKGTSMLNFITISINHLNFHTTLGFWSSCRCK